jgi:hypothetical protein
MRFIFACLIFCALSLTAFAQSAADEVTTIEQSGYSILAGARSYQVNAVVIVSNPFENRFARYPSVQVTIKAADGSIIAAREMSGAGIPPKGKIAIGEVISADAKPASVTFRPLRAGYEETSLRPADFRPFTIGNLTGRETSYGVRLTGEITNPYAREMGAWVYLVLRDKQGKLIGSLRTHKSEVPPGEPLAFEMGVRPDEIPEQMESYDKMVFSHFNYQDSWLKALGKKGGN